MADSSSNVVSAMIPAAAPSIESRLAVMENHAVSFLSMASLTRLTDLLREKHMKLSQVESCFLSWLVREMGRREPDWETFADMFRAYPPDWVYDAEIDGRSDILKLFFDTEAQAPGTEDPPVHGSAESASSILHGLVGKTEDLIGGAAAAAASTEAADPETVDPEEEEVYERSRNEEMLMRSRPESDQVWPREMRFDSLDFWETIFQCVLLVTSRMIGHRRVAKDRDRHEA